MSEVSSCLGHYGEDNPCADCEFRRVCQVVTAKYILRDEAVALIDEALAGVEAQP